MVGGKLQALANNHEDYKRFYHNVNGEQVRHDKVHNLFGYNMTVLPVKLLNEFPRISES